MKYKLLNALTAVILFLVPIVSFGQAPILGATASNYVLFTTNGAMTNSGIPHLTHLTGNVGSNLAGSISGFGNVDGQMHAFDTSTAACVTNVLALYMQLDTATTMFSPVSPILGNGSTLVPGVYQYPLLTAASLNLDLTLDGLGNSNSVFIIKIDGAFATNPNAKVKLINGAVACNVFWKIEGLVTMAPGTTMRGTILAHNAAINMNALDTLEGRAFSINGAVTTNNILAYMPLGCGSPILTGPAAPPLGAAAIFGVFSSIGAVTATPITFVNGDVGSNSTTTTGFDPLNVTGTIHTPPDAATAAAAGSLTLAYNYLVALQTDIELLDPANFGYDLVLTPHTYHMASAPVFLTGSLYLNAQGNPNAVFVINLNGAFITSTLSKIILINGAQAKNVYWKIDGATHIFDNSVFNGTIVGAGAITLNSIDTLNGRALTINGAVAINGSYVTAVPPICVASPIIGVTTVCQGATTTLSDIDTGGTWTSSNPAISTVGSSSGIVTGVTPGVDTITFTSGLACVSRTPVTVNAAPSAGSISGPSSVCTGSFIVLTDATPGGIWSTTNATASVLGGTVTGLTAGIDTIKYSVTGGGCTGTATKAVTVNAPAAPIAGPSSVCVGSSIVLTDATPGGVWSSSNASATVLGGTVTGIAPGIDTIRYTATSGGCTGTVTKTITVNSLLPNAGVVTGASNVCVGSSTPFIDLAPGGAWSSSNVLLATVGSTGIVTGVAPGVPTISYSVTNACGISNATKSVTVNSTAPSVAPITGTMTVCTGGTTTLSDATGGGIWSSSNILQATVGSTGIVTGVSPGNPTISYTVINGCGTGNATVIMTVNTFPTTAPITGIAVVCAGATTALSDATGGGVWSSSNTALATVGSTGVVTGVAAGNPVISYSVTTSCGPTNATRTITVNPLPDAGTIAGASSVCVGSSITLTDGAPGGAWSATNGTAAVTGATVTGVIAGIDSIRYSVTNGCGTDVAIKTIIVNPLPDAGIITSSSGVCIGSTITLTDAAPGGVWSGSNVTASVTGATITGVTSGVDTVRYTVTNVCGTATATKIMTINALPAPPVITTQAPSAVCKGAMYQNFGASGLPLAGTTYNWTAINAIVWAQGTSRQYALINFPASGIAYVSLNAIVSGTGCTSKTTITVNVSTDIAQPTVVSYFNNHFVCTPSNEGSYQWGYDDVHTLDSTVLAGEINQDYLNAAPDFSNKSYWVMTVIGGCMQKTYYTAPTTVQNINDEVTVMTVYPNPANDMINVAVISPVHGNMQLEIVNMLGQKINMVPATDNKATIDVTALATGSYIVTCYNDGIKIASARFIKN